ncbi:hypothetical protein BGW80DRAFT_1249728 [Lactifluus volemus]|nr:hypothetical protein BGW80DRAFT_1249728 [Lactifluus volemus]
MARLGHAIAFVILLCGTHFFTSVTGRISPQDFIHRKHEAAKKHSKATRPSSGFSQVTGKNITFSNPKASGSHKLPQALKSSKKLLQDQQVDKTQEPQDKTSAQVHKTTSAQDDKAKKFKIMVLYW